MLAMTPSPRTTRTTIAPKLNISKTATTRLAMGYRQHLIANHGRRWHRKQGKSLQRLVIGGGDPARDIQGLAVVARAEIVVHVGAEHQQHLRRFGHRIH